MASKSSSGSPSFSFSFDGIKEAIDSLELRVAAASQASDDWLREAAYTLETEAKKRAGEGGRHKRGTPTPATQGSGPAVVSGTLRRSIHTQITYGINRMAMVGPSAIYGRRVELEYDYPYMGPTVTAMYAPLRRLAMTYYKKALRV